MARRKVKSYSRRYSTETLEQRHLLATLNWDGGGDGTSWNDPLNWSTNTIPTVADDVTINIAGSPTIVISATTATARTLTSFETISATANLTVDGNLLTSAPIEVKSGRTLSVKGNLDLNSTLTLGSATDNSSGTLSFNSTSAAQHLSGAGTVNSAGTGIPSIWNRSQSSSGNSGYTLFVDSSVVVSLNHKAVIDSLYGWIINDGTIRFTGPGQTTSTTALLRGISKFRNNGLIEIRNGVNVVIWNLQHSLGGDLAVYDSTVTLTADWHNYDGSFFFEHSIVKFGDLWEFEDLGACAWVDSTAYIAGVLDNTSHVFSPSDPNVQWILGDVSASEILGGVIAGTQTLLARGGRLTGVTVNSPILVDSAGGLSIRSNLTLNSTITIVPQPQLYTNSLGFYLQAQVISGNGSFNITNDNPYQIYNSCAAGPNGISLTIESGITFNLRAKTELGCFEQSATTINRGTINFDGNGIASAEAKLGGPVHRFINEGTINAANGASVVAPVMVNDLDGVINITDSQFELTEETNSPASWDNNGTIVLNSGTLNLGGVFQFEDYGAVIRHGGDVNISGIFNSVNQMFVLNDSTGDWGVVNTGEILAGTIETTGNHRLIGRGGELVNVVMNGRLDVPGGGSIHPSGSFVLNSTLTLGSTSNNLSSSLSFRGSAMTFEGTGSVVQVGGGTASIVNALSGGTNGILTIAPTVSINLGPRAAVKNGTASQKTINYADIYFDGQNSSTSLVNVGANQTTFENRGTLNFYNGAKANMIGMTGDLNDIVIHDPGTRVWISSGNYVLNHVISVPLQTTLALSGTWVRNASMNILGSVIFDHGNDNGATYNAIKAAIASGYNNGTWDGEGLRDPLALTTPNTTLLAAKSAGLLGPTGGTYDGVPVDSTAVIVRHTNVADANLDGTINFSDLLIVAQHYGQSGGLTEGDLNGDGVVNFLDLLMIAQNYGQSVIASSALGFSMNAMR